MARAAILSEFGADLKVEWVEMLPVGPTDVRVQVGASGICQSDITLITGKYGPLFQPPLVPGHECAATVMEIGSKVTSVKPGDRVIAAMVPVCGHCYHCVRGETYICEMHSVVSSPDRKRVRLPDGRAAIGFTGLGAFADEMVLDEASVVKVESDLPDQQLALLGCGVATGVGAALNTAGMKPGSTAAIIACGGVGLSVVQGARIAGAVQIIAIDPLQPKRDHALAFGATETMDPNEGDVVAQVKEATGGRGVDYAFEVLGRPQTIVQARQMTRLGGTTVLVGATALGEPVTLDAFDLHREGRIVGCGYGSCQVRGDFARLIKLAESGQLNLKSMITREIGLAEINEGLRALKSGEVVRSLVVPGLDG
jgi:S-(hydroxymethyl)glutathione dehydrogenase/alcohol dehydrogenase